MIKTLWIPIFVFAFLSSAIDCGCQPRIFSGRVDYTYVEYTGKAESDKLLIESEKVYFLDSSMLSKVEAGYILNIIGDLGRLLDLKRTHYTKSISREGQNQKRDQLNC